MFECNERQATQAMTLMACVQETKRKERNARGDNFAHTHPPPPFQTAANFCVRGRVPNIMNHAKFQLNRLRC